jgi:non-specific serine/threonine protein kinase
MLACLDVAQGRVRRAARLFGVSEGLREAIGAMLMPWIRPLHEGSIARARSALGQGAFEMALAEGRAMPLAEVVEYALRAGEEPETEAAPTRRAQDPLTPREREVAGLVARGCTNRQIAEALVIAEGTAERHVGNILQKLDFASRAQLAAWAVERRLREPERA